LAEVKNFCQIGWQAGCTNFWAFWRWPRTKVETWSSN